MTRHLWIPLLAAAVVSAADLHAPAADAAKPPALFARGNLIAWCVVPFDAKGRGPRERAGMLKGH